VAVSDSPAGPFVDALGKPLVAAGSYSGQMIDSAVSTDDDGKSYLYWGNGNAYQVRLNDDMISFDPSQVKTYHPTNYNEGSFADPHAPATTVTCTDDGTYTMTRSRCNHPVR